MIIALDYDKTFTADKTFWRGFVFMAIAAGHSVQCVTMRHEHEAITDFPGQVWYTGRRAKKPWCESNGLTFDIWIDDEPKWVLFDSL